MTVFQLLMLGAAAFFAFKIYEHVQTLKDPQEGESEDGAQRNANAFSPHNAQTLVAKAEDAYEQEDFSKALALLKEADTKDQNNPDILYRIGFMLEKLGDFDEALHQYKNALEFDKNNEYFHNSIASIYRVKGEYASARMHLNASLDIDPQNPVTHYNYGNLLVDMKNTEQALEMYEKAVELDPEFTQAQEEIAKLKTSLKDTSV
ncbi:MAG: tetratricopeptide repeat protein [Helicobacteraceae bacterium]|nr:tetratricopeptide repeat protein [Helicobacteraceae bacterium]